VAGELIDIGFRPRLVASFDPPEAAQRFREWQAGNAEMLASVAPAASRVEYGRTGEGLYVRVRIDESQLPQPAA
jgi:hypothetical protein